MRPACCRARRPPTSTPTSGSWCAASASPPCRWSSTYHRSCADAESYLPQPTALRYHSMLALDRRCVVVAGGENFRARRNISSALLVCLYRCVVLSTAQWYHCVLLLISAASRPRAGTSWPRTMAAPRTAPRSSPAASTSSAGGRRPGCWTPCAGSWSGHNMSVYISCHFLSQVSEGFRIHHICVI